MYKPQVMDKLWDIVIVGGGLGGLSLAAELTEPEFVGLSVLVLEKRNDYVRDRTWSYWATAPHRYSHLERQRWNQWTVSTDDVAHLQSSPRSYYASLDANAFYRAAVEAISASPNVVLQMRSGVADVQVLGPLDSLVNLEHSGAVRARRVIDARPTKLPLGTLVQQFEGWEVQVKHDVFNPDQVQLMAFQPNPHGLHFFYTLPYSSRCALVESTWISFSDWQPDFQLELHQYLLKLLGDHGYTVNYRECGILGLQDAQGRAGQSAGLGRCGGTLRPATGFAFIDTLAHAAQIAKSLAAALRQGTYAAWHPLAFRRSATDQWMDAVFLEALSNDWLRAPSYFMAMFSTVAVDDTVAFLTGQATWQQRLRVMRSLPVAPFARAALNRELANWFSIKSSGSRSSGVTL